jgi:acyl dehydratase
MALYYEQFAVGQIFEHMIRRTVTEMDNMLFCSLTLNIQPLHIDYEFAAKTEFGRPIVNSCFTLGLVVGATVPETVLGTTIAHLGYTVIDFPAPVFYGDTIHVETEILSKRDSKSRPRAGIVEFEHRGLNQADKLVCLVRRSGLMHRLPPGGESDERPS